MNKCTKCEIEIDDHRFHLGYTECVDCSDTEKYSAHTVYPHKTGGYIQPVKSETKKHLQNIDRRSTGSGRRAKGIMADKSWDRWLKQYWHDKYNPKPKKKRVVKVIRKDYMNTKEAFRLAYNEYDKLGYQSALDLLQKLYTEDKKEILDVISSWWVNIHGHSHPYIAKAIAEQATRLEHVIFAGFTHEPAIRLAERLLEILPDNQEKIFFSDNGSTATEVGIKMAFQYFHNQGVEKKKIIAIDGAYHGDTFGAMSVGDRGPFTAPFDPYLFEVEFIDFPEKEKEDEVWNQFVAIIETGEVASFIFEPLVQGASGMRFYSAELLNRMIAFAQQHDVICISDEVMTGFGRLGTLFAADQLENKPDIICLSK